MAYAIIRSDIHTSVDGAKTIGETEITAILDEASDLDSLGTTWRPGSVAIVADKGTPTYMLNASKVWKEV